MHVQRLGPPAQGWESVVRRIRWTTSHGSSSNALCLAGLVDEIEASQGVWTSMCSGTFMLA